LVACDIVSLETQSCVAGCGGMESAQHLFLYCNIFGSLWSAVRSWIDLSLAILKIREIILYTLLIHQVVYEHGTFLQLIWLLCVWIIWIGKKNHRLFRNSDRFLPQLLEKVKLYSYLWLKTNYHSWWLSLFTCLDID
jgi:hypothetical protein